MNLTIDADFDKFLPIKICPFMIWPK